jgi:hypothetical protein
MLLVVNLQTNEKVQETTTVKPFDKHFQYVSPGRPFNLLPINIHIYVKTRLIYLIMTGFLYLCGRTVWSMKYLNLINCSSFDTNLLHLHWVKRDVYLQRVNKKIE